jgi:hypothetical protein
MSHTNHPFVFAYVLLVGVPLLGLAGVLRTGRTLTPPISVDGVWRVEANTSHLPPQSCSKAFSSLANSSFVISQSGKSLVLTFGGPSKTIASGVIEGKSVTASTGPGVSSIDLGCGADQSLVLTATVDSKSEPRSLAGVLAVNNCASCMPVEFHAVRQPRGQAGGAH